MREELIAHLDVLGKERFVRESSQEHSKFFHRAASWRIVEFFQKRQGVVNPAKTAQEMFPGIVHAPHAAIEPIGGERRTNLPPVSRFSRHDI